jgi:hypothetical protein
MDGTAHVCGSPSPFNAGNSLRHPDIAALCIGSMGYNDAGVCHEDGEGYALSMEGEQ